VLRVHVAQPVQGVRRHPRAQPLSLGQSRREVGGGLLEAPQPPRRLAPVVEREHAQRGEPGEVGEAHRRVQLGERLGVVALLQESGSAVGPDADELQDVARPLGVIQGP
jgi:hypothetical protein